MQLNQKKETSQRLWKPIVSLSAISALIIAVTFGCEGTTDTGITKADGSAADSTFQLVSDQFSPSDFDDVGLDWIDLLMDNLPGITTSTSDQSVRPILARGVSQSNSDTAISVQYVIDENSGWITFTATIASNSDTFTVVDSMLFTNLAGVAFIPTGSVDIDSISRLDIRVHGSVTTSSANDFAGSVAIHSSLTIEVIGRDTSEGDLDTIRINGLESDTLTGVATDSLSGQCSITMAQTTTITNLVGLSDDSTDSCPLSGQIQVNAVIDASCSFSDGPATLDFTDTWLVTMTFHGGDSATVVLENATTRWETTQSCGSGSVQAGSKFGNMADLATAVIE